MKEKRSANFQTTLAERITFGVYGTGLSIYFVLIGTFLQQYCLVEAAIPASMLAVVFLIAKIWDAINDPLFGVVVDRVRLRSGKFLPWMRVATVFLPLTASLLFFIPKSFSNVGKCVFLLVAYMLYDSASTLTEVPYFALTTAMTDNPLERSSIINTSKIIAYIPAMAILFIPSMYNSIGWQKTILIFSFYSFLTMLPGCLKLKERFTPPRDSTPSIGDLWRFLKGNRYLVIYFVSAVLYGIFNTSGGVATLFVQFNLGNSNLIAPLLIASFIPSVLAIVFVNRAIARFDKIHLVLGAHAVIVVSSVLMYLFGYGNFPAFLILIAVRGFATGAHTALYFLFAPDFAEYGAFRSGIHAEGTAFSMQSLASKLINALAGSFGLLVLSLFGFLEGSLVQDARAMQGIWLLSTLIPLIGVLLQAGILITLYKLRDRDVALMNKVNHGEMDREEALALMGGIVK